MATPSPVSPSMSLFSSPMISTSQTSTAFCSPLTKKHARFMPFLSSSYDVDSSDDDDDIENIDPRKGPTTPSKKTGSTTHLTPSPSKFIVRGTVTPSRAAPLFARFTQSRRSSSRLSPEEETEYEGSEGSDIEATAAAEAERPQEQAASFVEWRTNLSGSDMPLMPIPVMGGLRHRASTQDIASYLLSMRSNALHHMHYACSTHSNFGGSSGRGILGVSRMLGAGSSLPSVSHRSFHKTFQTSSTPEKDLFVVPSMRGDDELSHPLCAEYAKSSRNLNNYQAQWLAVGDNEGRVHLINTLFDPMASVDTELQDKPRWEACHGSIFELKWRFDDEVIATGGSDYVVRLWSPETGRELRAFKGHRGSPRTIAWDPYGSGNTLVSGGRDGAIHLYDVRVKDRSVNGEPWSPCLSLWEAHTMEEPPRPPRGPGSRGGGARGKASIKQPKAVTSVAYLPNRGAHLLASAGCVDGKIKIWDFRFLESESAATGAKNFGGANRKKARNEDITLVDPLEQGIDVTKQLVRRLQPNKSSHGISSIVIGADKLFAACTDGRIYTMKCADLLQTGTTQLGHAIPPLYHPAQRSNTVYARMALHDDDRTLALGCNSGAITLWDTHAASLSLGQIYAEDPTFTGEVNSASNPLRQMAQPAVLQRGHSDNFEVNCVSWAHGPQGPTLASISDDYTIRTWHSSPRQEGMPRRQY